MLKSGILNPSINALLCRVRHTNMLVIADRGFPYWPMIETIDISLVDNIPTVLQVLNAIRPNFVIGEIVMACEFQEQNSHSVQAHFAAAMEGIAVTYVPHLEFKRRVPDVIGLIRTADTIQFANMILVSA